MGYQEVEEESRADLIDAQLWEQRVRDRLEPPDYSW